MIKESKVRKHRAYENDYASVTEALGVLRKIGLEMWFKFNTLEYCNKASGKGKVVGTDIHKAIENYMLTGQATVESQYPDEVTCALHSFVKFRKDYPHFKLQLSEQALTSEIHKFNGTIDCIAEIDGMPVILDWKSGEAKKKECPIIYDEYKYQVSAYVHLYNEINPGKFIDTAIIVSIAKDKVCYQTYQMNRQEIDDCFNEVFLPALRIYNYQKRKL